MREEGERERGWCFYLEDVGDSFRDGFASLDAALNAAVRFYGNGIVPTDLRVGTSIDPQTQMRFDAEQIAEGIADDLEVEDCGTYLLDGAQEALDVWIQKYVRSEARSVCLDGRAVTVEEWEAATRRVASGSGAGEASDVG